MAKKIAVCAVAQIKNDPNYHYLRFQNMLLECFESIVGQTKVTFDMEKGIRTIITCSDKWRRRASTVLATRWRALCPAMMI